MATTISDSKFSDVRNLIAKVLKDSLQKVGGDVEKLADYLAFFLFGDPVNGKTVIEYMNSLNLLNEMPIAYRRIADERDRQDAKWGEQNHSNMRWLAILSEEVGEVAKAMLWNTDVSQDEIYDEITHVAAVAVAWMDAIDRRRMDTMGVDTESVIMELRAEANEAGNRLKQQALEIHRLQKENTKLWATLGLGRSNDADPSLVADAKGQ
jgi:NTP pyrophosphatase (non-canonical NTP hydrolase)